MNTEVHKEHLGWIEKQRKALGKNAKTRCTDAESPYFIGAGVPDETQVEFDLRSERQK